MNDYLATMPPELGRLVFPLNAYAVAIWQEEGRLDYLHYGFDPANGGMARAQQRSTDFLLERLPEPPARILEVGIGLGTTGRQLHALGYDYWGVTPDQAQIAHAQQRWPEAQLLLSRFQDLEWNGPEVDVVLFQESSQYMSTFALLNKARALLKSGGQVLILDEVERCQIPALVQLAQGLGFAVVESTDVTTRAAPSIDYLAALIERQVGLLQRTTGASERAIAALVAELGKRRAAYHEGRFGYFGFRLIKSRAHECPG